MHSAKLQTKHKVFCRNSFSSKVFQCALLVADAQILKARFYSRGRPSFACGWKFSFHCAWGIIILLQHLSLRPLFLQGIIVSWIKWWMFCHLSCFISKNGLDSFWGTRNSQVFKSDLYQANTKDLMILRGVFKSNHTFEFRKGKKEWKLCLLATKPSVIFMYVFQLWSNALKASVAPS